MSPGVTICLLNYKRPQNLSLIIEALRRQTVQPKIFLWDNAHEPLDCEVDWHVKSSSNMRCWPRWFMASQAETEFVSVIDDDLLPTEGDLFESLMAVHDKYQKPDMIIGPYGVLLESTMSYRRCSHLRLGSNDPVASDIIKGRLMFARTADIRDRLPLVGRLGSGMEMIHDDIAVSGILAGGRVRHHVCLPSVKSKLREMEETDAIWKRRTHYSERELVRRLYFP